MSLSHSLTPFLTNYCIASSFSCSASAIPLFDDFLSAFHSFHGTTHSE